MRKNSFHALVLSLALGLPALHAQDRPAGQSGENARAGGHYAYYDSKHREWHQWNEEENRSYHQYLNDKHKPDHDFSTADEREQQDYWKWRRQHTQQH